MELNNLQSNNLGWIILFYLGEGQTSGEDNGKEFPYLSWSPYDRLDIKEISSFNKFFENQYRTWHDGVAQQMHLIPEYPFSFSWKVSDNENTDTDSFLIYDTSVKQQFSLNCIITTRFTAKVKNSKKLREKVYEELNKVAMFDKTLLVWAAFNSLDSESIVFILLGNDIKNFAKFGEILKGAKVGFEKEKKKDLFSAITSFVGFNINMGENKIELKEPEADLIIRLNLKSKDMYHPVVSKLVDKGVFKDDIVNLFLGKCVLDVRIKNRQDLLSYFQPEGMFNGDSKFYGKYISSSRSYWCVEPQQVQSFVIEETITNFLGETSWENILQDIDKNEDDIKYPLVQFVLKEYVRLINSEQCSAWAPILSQQYKTVYDFAKRYAKSGRKRELYSFVKHLANVLQHIRQASTPVAEVPYHNYTYSGSYNDILRMYYGVIATLFEVGFLMPHVDDNQQHKINFCVDFESAMEIHSSMYSPEGDQEMDVERFIVFHLPFNSFANIEKTVKLLSHEVFHYIAPYDRRERNKLLVKSWTKTVLNRIIMYYTKENIPEEILETVMQKFWDNQDLYEQSYKSIIKINPGIEGCILNDFINEGENLRSLSRALGVVSSMIIDKVDNLILETSEKEKKYSKLRHNLENITNTVQEGMKNDITYKYIQTELVKNARAYKEVFCDIGMLKIFNMDVNDYIQWFYDVSFREFEDIYGELFDTLELEKKNIRIMSVELRMGIIFDFLCGCDERTDSYESFKKYISKFPYDKYKNNTNGIIKFVKYCDKTYSVYLAQKASFRNLYQRLFNYTLRFWEKPSPKAQKLIDELSEITEIKKDINLNTKTIDLFISKNIVDEFNEIQDAPCLKYQEPPYKAVKAIGNLSIWETASVSKLSDYIEQACRITGRMRENTNVFGKSFWYRGICDENHTLLPGLYRLYDVKNQKNSLIGKSLYNKQLEILEDAYYLTMNMPDLWKGQLQDISERMCCLQHYGMITNLLDFSLDMLTALHFALNPDARKDKEMIKEGKYRPRVVIFNPIKYNKAIRSLEMGKVVADEESEMQSPVLFDINGEKLEEYFVNDVPLQKTQKIDKNVQNSMENKYPVPVIMRQSNSRILAQNGVFLAYNLRVNVDEKYSFSQFDLRQIQLDYINLFKDRRKAQNEKFLEEIAIEPFAVERLREELKVMGINTGKMYPELSKIFEQYREGN